MKLKAKQIDLNKWEIRMRNNVSTGSREEVAYAVYEANRWLEKHGLVIRVFATEDYKELIYCIPKGLSVKEMVNQGIRSFIAVRLIKIKRHFAKS